MASNAPITGARRRAPNILTRLVPGSHKRDAAQTAPDAPHLHLRVAPPRIERDFSVLARHRTIADEGQRAIVPAHIAARLRKDGPDGIPAIGDQADLLQQRFGLLDADNRAELLDSARHLIERQEEAKRPPLPPREARIARLIEIADRTIMVLGSGDAADTIERRVQRGILKDIVAELFRFGITYFAGRGGQRKVGLSHGC